VHSNADDLAALIETPDRVNAEVAAADAARIVAFLDWVVDVVLGDGEDCARMAKDIGATIDANQAVVAMASAAKKEGSKLPAGSSRHMIEGVEKLMPAMLKCARDPKIQDAFKKLDKAS